MFRSLSGDGQFSGGQSSSSAADREVTSPGLDSQENSWIGLLSRPAVSFLQRYLPGRPRAPARPGPGADWIKSSLVEERELLRQLDDLMPEPRGPPLSGLLEPVGGFPWLSVESLRDMGLQSPEEVDLSLCQQSQLGYLSSVRTFFSHVLLSSSAEVRPPVGGRTWWGSLWGGEDSSHRGLRSDLSPVQPSETKGPQTAAVCGGERWMLGENTGPSDHKEQPANKGPLHAVQNSQGSTADCPLSITHHRTSPGAAACSEVALLTPDQDNGYSSLEEEHFQVSHLNMASEEQESAENTTATEAETEDEPPEEGESAPGQEEEEEEEEEASQEGSSAGAVALAAPHCQNKAIAFIMGCPCSDDDSQSDEESSEEEEEEEDEDDDGFDSEGSSDLSDSTDEDDEEEEEESDSEADSEAERLWSSLCQSVDPYNPRNFTARLHTASTLPRAVPASSPPSSTHSPPPSSPPLASPPRLARTSGTTPPRPARRTKRRASACGPPSAAPPTPTAPSTSRPRSGLEGPPRWGPGPRPGLRKPPRLPLAPPITTQQLHPSTGRRRRRSGWTAAFLNRRPPRRAPPRRCVCFLSLLLHEVLCIHIIDLLCRKIQNVFDSSRLEATTGEKTLKIRNVSIHPSVLSSVGQTVQNIEVQSKNVNKDNLRDQS
ncbi:uncharacterized protein LOC121940015, partial [Plectropomus leopardus]|uniref:uncharacterized protein LOC121940015 n=1 Tax=Plectropomus leopardus TaxID=160734 RepID=UPI001C4C64B7